MTDQSVIRQSIDLLIGPTIKPVVWFVAYEQVSCCNDWICSGLRVNLGQGLHRGRVWATQPGYSAAVRQAHLVLEPVLALV
jgi:hypothetical protein